MAIAFLLDTDTVSLALKGRAPHAVERLRSTPRSSVAISVITAMELEFGLAKHPTTRNRQAVRQFLEAVAVAPLLETAVGTYASIRAELERRGAPIRPLDTLIAAHAMALNATLVTANVREFRRIPTLNVEDWARPHS